MAVRSVPPNHATSNWHILPHPSAARLPQGVGPYKCTQLPFCVWTKQGGAQQQTMSTSSSSQGHPLLRIAMPVASSLILAYYVFTLPMSFMGGSSGDAKTDITGELHVPTVQSKMEVAPLVVAAPKAAATDLSSKEPKKEPALDVKKEALKAKGLEAVDSEQNVDLDAVQPKEPRKRDPERKSKSVVKPLEEDRENVIEKENAADTDPVPILDEDDVKSNAKEEPAEVNPELGGDLAEIRPKEDVSEKVFDGENRENAAEEDLTSSSTNNVDELVTQEETRDGLDVPPDAMLGLGADVFHSFEIFKRNYQEMEKRFKVFIYPDGDPDTYYQTPRKITGKYASEGYFFQNLRESKFVTKNPDKAHLFFLPISCHKMRGKGISYERMADIIQEYVDGLIAKYPYWNRTLGADHFFVTCHDVGARATNKAAHLVKNAIRVVCSPSYNGDFIPHKDVAMPQVLQPFALPRGGNDVKNRTVLGFWAGHRNSKIRVTLARLWENDDVLAISNNRISRATGELLYQKQFYKSKFCICPGGSQVNSARIADSIHYGCVPVIMSDFYDLPFSDVLNWQKFAVILRERDVTHLKSKLQSITQKQYLSLHKGLLQVQDRFEWHTPPTPYDAFHMVMYELWLRHFTVQYKK